LVGVISATRKSRERPKDKKELMQKKSGVVIGKEISSVREKRAQHKTSKEKEREDNWGLKTPAVDSDRVGGD